MITEPVVFQLKNGIRVVHQYLVREVAHCGLMIGAGSRDELRNEHGLQDVIRRLTILTQVDDIITLRKNEDAEREQYFEKVNAWQKQHNISMFDADYREKMDACPFKAPTAIDEINVSAMKYEPMRWDI